MASAILALSDKPSALGPLEASAMPSGVSLRFSMAALSHVHVFTCVAMAAGLLALSSVLVALFGLSTGMCLSGSLRLFVYARGRHAQHGDGGVAINLIPATRDRRFLAG